MTDGGGKGLWFHDAGRPVAALAIETDGERILNVYAVVNPEKLAASVTIGDRGTS